MNRRSGAAKRVFNRLLFPFYGGAPSSSLAWLALTVGGSIALPSADHSMTRCCCQPYSTLTLSIQQHPGSQRKLENVTRKLQRVPPGTGADGRSVRRCRSAMLCLQG